MRSNCLVGIFAAVLLSACLTTTDISQSDTLCRSADVTLSKSFEAGRFSECSVIGKNHFQLSLAPENKPINASPWYAFAIDSESPKTLLVTLKYQHHKHRYVPKLSSDGDNWSSLDEQNIQISEDKKTVDLTIPLMPGKQLIAAQPILDNSSYQSWLSQFSKRGEMVEVIGRSAEGRRLMLLKSLAGNDLPTVILLGRQHPPEVTGAIAMKAFVERLFVDDALAKAFREQFNVLIFPNINPDGVAKGNWRHNVRGKDLNRDWGPFTEPETRQVIEAIESHGADNIWSMVDFHSTWRDLFYTQRDSQPSLFPSFTADWMSAINTQSTGITFIRKPGHNATAPTSKTYFYERFKIPAITYELGDNSDIQQIEDVAKLSAETYMQQLLIRKER